MWFCSELCQKTLWPVHKTRCGGDPKYFRQAPLTDKELKDLETVKDSDACQGNCGHDHGKTFRENYNAREILQSSPKILEKPEPRTDYRKLCLLDARRKLCEVYKVTDRKRVATPWVEIEWYFNTANWALSRNRQSGFLRDEELQMTAVAAQALNNWLRQAIIYCQVADIGMKWASMMVQYLSHTWVRLVCVHWDRLDKLLNEANITARAKEEMRNQMAQKRNALKNMRRPSSECQRRVRPVHKALCGGSTRYFRQAPLSKEEFVYVEKVKHLKILPPIATAMYQNAPIVLLEEILVNDFPGITSWAHSATLLKSTTAEADTAHTRQDVDYSPREMVILGARKEIRKQGKIDGDTLGGCQPWPQAAFMTGMTTSIIMQKEPGSHESFDNDGIPISGPRLNAFLRQDLIFSLLLDDIARTENRRTPEYARTVELWKLAAQRVIAELDRVPIHRETRRKIRDEVDMTVDGVHDMMGGP